MRLAEDHPDRAFFFVKFSNGWASVPGSLDRSLVFLFFQKNKRKRLFSFLTSSPRIGCHAGWGTVERMLQFVSIYSFACWLGWTSYFVG